MKFLYLLTGLLISAILVCLLSGYMTVALGLSGPTILLAWVCYIGSGRFDSVVLS